MTPPVGRNMWKDPPASQITRHTQGVTASGNGYTASMLPAMPQTPICRKRESENSMEHLKNDLQGFQERMQLTTPSSQMVRKGDASKNKQLVLLYSSGAAHFSTRLMCYQLFT